MKGIVVYKGKYGATAQYAAWAGEELNLPVMATHECSGTDLEKTDVVVLGTSVYIGMLVIKEWIKINLESLKGKRIFLFVVCGTPVNEKEKLEGFVKGSVPEDILKKCKTYFFPGRLTFKKLSWSDKFLLRVGYFFSSKKQKDDMHLADYDAVKKENMTDLIADVEQAFNINEELLYRI